jgi:hypothetical protein
MVRAPYYICKTVVTVMGGTVAAVPLIVNLVFQRATG